MPDEVQESVDQPEKKVRPLVLARMDWLALTVDSFFMTSAALSGSLILGSDATRLLKTFFITMAIVCLLGLVVITVSMMRKSGPTIASIAKPIPAGALRANERTTRRYFLVRALMTFLVAGFIFYFVGAGTSSLFAGTISGLSAGSFALSIILNFRISHWEKVNHATLLVEASRWNQRVYVDRSKSPVAQLTI